MLEQTISILGTHFKITVHHFIPDYPPPVPPCYVSVSLSEGVQGAARSVICFLIKSSSYNLFAHNSEWILNFKPFVLNNKK